MTAAALVSESPTSADPSVIARLQPVRRALLDDAESAATSIIDEARAVADRLVADAEREAAREIDTARHRGERSAQAQVERDLASALATARSGVLDAQRRIRDEAIRAVHGAVTDMRADPRYPALLDHLEAEACEQLGQGAIIERDPDAGGVVAVADQRRVDYTLPALADRALAAHADEVAQLWS
jgi:vacuolar-type H+-ATPase subunit E/Vma4